MAEVRGVVMAGGEGSRLRPLTSHRPKPLVPVLNRPIMGHVIDLLRQHGVTDITCTLHYLAEEIQARFGDGSEWGVRTRYCLEPTPLGTAGSVRQAADWLREGTFIIASGDALTDCDLTAALAFHRAKGSLVTLVLKRVPDPLEFGIVITDDEGRIERFLEKPGWSEVFSDTVNTGIYIMEGEVLDRMEPDRPYDWSKDIFPQLLAEGAPMYGYVMEGYWTDVGTLQQYMEAQRDALAGALRVVHPGEEISPGVWVGEGTVIDPQAVIEAPVVIGRNCRLKAGVTVGPYTCLGDNVLTEEGARIENSVVWDACYIGLDVEVTGAILAHRVTAKRGAVIGEEVVVGDRCLIDVGANLRPRVKLWPDKVVDRGSTVTMSIVQGNRWRGSLFRELGVAGLSNIEATPEFATRLGLAFGSTLREHARIAVSRDSSRSSRMLKRSLTGALLSSGCDVIDLHGEPLPVTRLFTAQTRIAGAVNVRKLPGNRRMSLFEFLEGDGGYVARTQERKIEAAFYREEFRRIDPDELGVVDSASGAKELYRREFLDRIATRGHNRRPKIVVDFGYSSVVSILPNLLAELGYEVISLNLQNEARLAPRSYEEIQDHLLRLGQIVGALDSDLGILLTHEGERIHLVDDYGLPITGNTLFAAMCLLVCRAEASPKIAMSVTAPARLESLLAAEGAEVTRTRATGRDLIDAAARSPLSFLGDESGGFIWPSFHPGFDGMFAAAQIVEMMLHSDVRLSELIRSLPEFHLVYGQVQCPWDSKGTVMRRLAESSRDGLSVELTDGIKIYDDVGWVLVLPDSFEPVVHVYAESPSIEESQARLDACRTRLESWIEN